MNKDTIVLLLSVISGILFFIALFQQYQLRIGNRKKLREIERDLKAIMDAGTDEKVMVFTDNKVLADLTVQINRLLEDRQKTKAEFRRTELSSKRMLSNVSHDIKTPMTVILGYLEIMRLNGGGDLRTLQKTEQQAQRVMELINEFFTLAKLEAGDMDISLSKVEINEVCRETALDFYELLMQRQFQVEIKIPETSFFVMGNRDALQRIFFNLISNVIRYGSDGNYLGVFVRSDEKNVYVDIVDKGKGIEKTFAKTVFERLFTMEDSRNRQIQGNGLGLTIARNLAQQMGGDITLESTPHIRTVFTVALRRFASQSTGERNS